MYWYNIISLPKCENCPFLPPFSPLKTHTFCQKQSFSKRGSGEKENDKAGKRKPLCSCSSSQVLALCRGPYQREDNWGYAPDVAQVWRATGDHHDVFSSVLEQVRNWPSSFCSPRFNPKMIILPRQARDTHRES